LPAVVAAAIAVAVLIPRELRAHAGLTARVPTLDELVQDARGQPPNTPAFELDCVFVAGKRYYSRKRNDEYSRGLRRIDTQFARFDDCDEGRYVEVICNALMDDRQLVYDVHACRFDADLFVQLAQRGSPKSGVFGMHATARQPDLSRMIAQMRGTLDENDSVRWSSKNRDDDGGTPARTKHSANDSTRTR
jgi:hypothetical protein